MYTPFHLLFYPDKAYMRISVNVILPQVDGFDHISLTSETEIESLLSYGWRGSHPEGLLPRSTSFIHCLGLGFLRKQILGRTFEFKWLIKEMISESFLREWGRRQEGGKASWGYVNGQVAAVGDSDSILTRTLKLFPLQTAGNLEYLSSKLSWALDDGSAS